MRLIDLSYPIDDGMPNFPSDPPVQVAPHHSIASMGYNLTRISMSSHQGTHLDAPFHFYDDGRTIDQMNLTQFYGPATCIDLAPGGHLPAGQPLDKTIFQPFASDFVPGAKIIYRTGWDHMFGKPGFFDDFPSLTLEAAQWMAECEIGLLGMDTPTPSTDWQACHLILLKKDVEIVIVENLTHLEELPRAFTFIGFPMNIVGRDGSPIRAVGLVN